jgi:adenosylcobinamide kinase/adenosylcobinamide-phosphate guanylyltransferase
MANLTLILGGARSGKSRYAQEYAAALAVDVPVTYIATAQAGDDEMRDRISRHQADRPAHWHTVEEPLEVADTIRGIASEQASPVILIDCLTFFVVNHMLKDGDSSTCETSDFPVGGCASSTGDSLPFREGLGVGEAWDVDGAERAVDDLLDALYEIEATVVIVSNEVGMGLVPETPLGRAFRDCAGRANQAVAKRADNVIFMVAGIPMAFKGSATP